jgi:hypothetical protein
MSSKNLSFYFPDSNNAAGLKVFKEIGTALTGFYFKRSYLPNVLKEENSSNYAIYFLFDDSDNDPIVYIGQSTNGSIRIKDHVKKKEFWSFCIMVVSDNNSFDKSAIDYLEYHFIHKFKNTVYKLENIDNRNTQPLVNVFQKSTYDNYCNQIEFMLEANGIDFLEKKNSKEKDFQFFEASKGIKSKLYVKDDVFFLTKDSIISMPIESSKEWNDDGRFYKNHSYRFNELIIDGKAKTIENNPSKAILLEDIPFKSPSAAAEITSGYAETGWLFWKGLNEIRKIDRD